MKYSNSKIVAAEADTERSYTVLQRENLKISKLRDLLTKHHLVAFVCTNTDEHNSTFVGDCDEKCAYLSGFSGRTGVALVTHDNACLWTEKCFYN